MRKYQVKKAPKAYDNKRFIHSPAGREIRMLSEYQHPNYQFKKKAIKGTIIFFGSARSLPQDMFDKELYDMYDNESRASSENEKKEWKEKIEKHKLKESASGHYQDAMELARLLAEWSKELPRKYQYHVCTGGGPGIMEAANRGAAIAKMPSVGLNISLPYEQEPNRYITNDLNFEFHYFFMRKFWFIYLAKALVAFPGGFGTLDELFESLTLIQTRKLSKPLPILLYSRLFWDKLINFDYLVETGMISSDDLDLFFFADTPDEAYEIITRELIKIYDLDQFLKK